MEIPRSLQQETSIDRIDTVFISIYVVKTSKSIRLIASLLVSGKVYPADREIVAVFGVHQDLGFNLV